MTEALQKPAPAPAPDQVTLTTQDLSTAQQIINLCVSRGAIKAEEMAVVGALYNKLNSFLQASEAAKKAAEEAAAAESTKAPAKKAAKKKAPAKKAAASNDSDEK